MTVTELSESVYQLNVLCQKRSPSPFIKLNSNCSTKTVKEEEDLIIGQISPQSIQTMANAKNPFYDDEIDDDTFLRSGRGQRGQQGQDPSEVRRQQLLQRRREIEERTIDSSQRSIGEREVK